MATAKKAAARGGSYSASDIQVLEGLEPVRKRPAMYIGGTDGPGYHHLLWEIVDNCVDEVINGYAEKIEVTLHKDGKTVTVDRRRPRHPGRRASRSTRSRRWRSSSPRCTRAASSTRANYIHSGGLHGVGSSVVNALSSKLVAEVKRDGEAVGADVLARQAELASSKSTGPARGTGTAITFPPDAEIFGDKIRFDPEMIRERLEAKSYLHKGMEVVFRDETASPATEVELPARRRHRRVPGQARRRARQDAGPGAARRPSTSRARTPRARAGAWPGPRPPTSTSAPTSTASPPANGGTHEAGLRSGLVKAVRNYIETHELTPKGVTLTAEDIREGMVAILSIYVIEPQFQGQTKDRLNNPEMAGLVDNAVRPALEKWLNDNQSVAEAVVARIILAARAREASPRGVAGGDAQDAR